MKSKTAVIEDIKKMSVRVFDVRRPGVKEVLVKVYQCNICTADWQIWAGLRGSMGHQLPMAPGHEFAGEVIEVGLGVDEIEIGDHVAGFGPINCGECYYCHIGNSSKCVKRDLLEEKDGIKGSFGMAQYVLASVDQVYKISKELPYEEACYLEPLATAIHGIRKLQITPNDNVLVIGAGNLGLVNAQVARAYGGKVMVSEISDKRRKVSKTLGFDTINPNDPEFVKITKHFTSNRGFDAIILAVGNTEANVQALQVLGQMGRILFFAAGYPAPKMKIDPNAIHYNEYQLIGTYRADHIDFQIASKFLSEGIVKTDKLISYKVPIDDIQKAFELAATPGNYRVSVSMW